MNDLWTRIEAFFSVDRVMTFITAALILIIGFVLARLITRAVAGVAERRGNAQLAVLVRRLTYYALVGLVVISALHQLGVDLSVLLGAAGLMTVALGFASQTSASNVIAGLFLMGERPFNVGDVIRVGATTGTVSSVDLLSVKLTTFDNLLVRIPNETLLKSEITNITHHPIRRFDLVIGIPYDEDLERVRDVLYAVADENPVCLDEPKPLFLVLRFADSAVEIQFSPWAAQANFLELRNTIVFDVKQAFDAAGITIPFPQRTLTAGGAIPVQIVPPGEAPASHAA